MIRAGGRGSVAAEYTISSFPEVGTFSATSPNRYSRAAVIFILRQAPTINGPKRVFAALLVSIDRTRTLPPTYKKDPLIVAVAHQTEPALYQQVSRNPEPEKSYKRW